MTGLHHGAFCQGIPPEKSHLVMCAALAEVRTNPQARSQAQEPAQQYGCKMPNAPRSMVSPMMCSAFRNLITSRMMFCRPGGAAPSHHGVRQGGTGCSHLATHARTDGWMDAKNTSPRHVPEEPSDVMSRGGILSIHKLPMSSSTVCSAIFSSSLSWGFRHLHTL